MTKVHEIHLTKKNLLHQLIWRRLTKLLPLLTFVMFIALWQLGLTLANTPVYLIPKPTDIALAAIENWRNLTAALFTTMIESIIGLVLSVIFGVGGAIILASSKLVEKSIYPYLIVLQTIPIVALAPIIVIWFGAGLNAIVIITFLMGFFPMLTNTLIGLNSTDPNLTNLFRLYKANKFQVLLNLKLPYALPYIVAGMKISSTLVVIGAIVGEYIAGIGGGKGGLGFAITQSAMMLQTPYLFACALTAALLGITFFYGVQVLSKVLLSSWHESEMKKEK